MCRFSCLPHLIISFVLNNQLIPIFSVLTSLQDNFLLVTKATPTNFCKRVAFQDNVAFTANLILYSSVSIFATWLLILFFISGDVHPHPGPLSTTSSNSISSYSSSLSSTVFNSINLSHHLSFVHCTNDLVLDSYSKPERKDRVGDAHGGVMIYVKEYIHYRRRRDLEPRGVECIWIEIANNTKHALFGVYYRPPNSDSTYYTSIEDSLHLATDTGINDIIITGDFNFNLLHQQTIRKIDSLCN